MAENGRLVGTFRVASGLARMLKGGGIMDVVDAEQARIAEEAGVFVGTGIFKSGEPAARAIVKATTYSKDPEAVAEASRGLGQAMAGGEMGSLSGGERLAARGW